MLKVVSIFMVLLCFSTIFALTTSVSEKILARVHLNGVDLSNLTIDEGYQKLNETLTNNKKKNIVLAYEEYETTLSLEQLEVTYKTDEAINKAYRLGRNRNILISNFQIISNLLFGNQIEQTIEINEEELEKAISDIEVKLPNAQVDSSFYIEEDQLIITSGKTGAILQKEQLKDTLIHEIKNQIMGKEVGTITLPVEIKAPDTIDIESIYEEIHTKPQDAHYDETNKKLYKEENGMEFAISLEEAKNLLLEEKEEYTIPLNIIKPTITIKDLANKDFFPNLLAKFTTRYDETAENRATKIGRASCRERVYSYV